MAKGVLNSYFKYKYKYSELKDGCLWPLFWSLMMLK